MYPYVTMPTYGLMLTIALVSVNVIGWLVVKTNNRLSLENFILTESYLLLGAVIGSKLLYLLTVCNQIDWKRVFTELDYYRQVFYSGFVFYGGLLGSIIGVMVAKKIHKIDTLLYINEMVFLFPLAHAIGRIGCFLGGCCYGIPYTGIFAVTYPSNAISGVPTGIPLFPIQVLESFVLILLAIFLFFYKKKKRDSFLLYLLSYSIIRFFLEFLRYDSNRGKLLWLSTSQWISLMLFISCTIILIIKNYKKRIAKE